MVPTADFHNSEYVDAYFKVREYLCNFSGSNGTPDRRNGRSWSVDGWQIFYPGGAGAYRNRSYFIPDAGGQRSDEGRIFTAEDGNGQTLGFDGRVVDTRFGLKLEKDLADKQIKIVYGKDLADEVWTDRPALPCHPVLVPDEALFGQNVSEKLAAVRKIWQHTVRPVCF